MNFRVSTILQPTFRSLVGLIDFHPQRIALRRVIRMPAGRVATGAGAQRAQQVHFGEELQVVARTPW